MKRSYIALLLFVPVLSIHAPLHAQERWTSGRPDGHAPLGVMGDHSHEGGEVMLSYRFMGMPMDGLRDGTSSLTPEQVLDQYMVTPVDMPMWMHMFGIMYAPSDRLTLMVMAPYMSMDMDHRTRMGTTFTTRAGGFGDTKLTGLVQLFNRDRQAAHLHLGVSVPTGSIDERDVTPASNDQEVRLPYPMQIGSGTWDLLPGITYLGQQDKYSWGAQAKSTIRLGENDNEYRLGNRALATTWGAWRWNDRLSSSLRLEGQVWGNIEGADPALNPMMVPTADPALRAGQRVDALLGTNFKFAEGFFRGYRLAVEFGVPVYQSLDGPQLEQNWTLLVGWQSRPFGGH